MTLIKPNQNKNILKFIAFLTAVVAAGGALYVYGYAGLADVRYRIYEAEKRIVEAKTRNAELKDELYELIDPAVLRAFADEQGLVLEKKPEYLPLTPNGTAVSLR